MTSWMKNIPDDTLLSEINIPGTHDSCTRFVKFPLLARCQALSVEEQLNIGVRFLDLRVKKENNELLLVHGIAPCYEDSSRKKPLSLERVLRDCKSFLSSNPSETIIASLKRDDGVSPCETFSFFFENYLKNDDIWYSENRVPSLGEIRGKIVLFNRCEIDFSAADSRFTDYNTGLDFTRFPDQSKVDFTGFQTAFIPHCSTGGKEKFFLQDMYKLNPTSKWEKGVLPSLETNLDGKCIAFNFLSANTLLFNPRRTAVIVNKRFGNYPLKKLRNYGIIIFDFPTQTLCRKVILTNFN